MIYKDENKKSVILSNREIEVEILYGKGLCINRFEHRFLNINKKTVMKNTQKELFELDLEGKKYASSKFDVQEVSTCHDKTVEMISFLLAEKNSGLKARVCLINNLDNTLNLIVQMAAKWKDGYPKEIYLHIPFLANFSLGSNEEEEYYFPKNPRSKADGSSIMQLNDNFKLPMGVFEKKSKIGFSIQFPIIGNYLVYIWDQKRNHDLCNLKSIEEIKTHKILLRLNKTLTDVFELKFTAVTNGWVECFKRWKESMREKLIFTQYERDDLKWYRDSFLHHFTFIYSKEVYNYETNEIEIDRLIKQGEAFGGYDAIILWHQYPRLGVDDRSQWDFFNDFPGGKSGIKKVVNEAHSKGVKVFLPYKPWDIKNTDSIHVITKEIVDLIKETNIDGMFFDTMNSVPKGFREAVDRVKKGIVFCTEVQPENNHNINLITGSWDQYGNNVSMPETNLLRYVIPEHFSPIIARWHVGVKKDILIKRAVFNGTGIVIWQDIFGSWLPYSDEQKNRIKKWKQILKDNKDIYFCSSPIPLYPTLKKGIYCNYFPSNDGKKVIYSIYNDLNEQFSKDLLIHETADMTKVVELLKGANVKIKESNKGKIISSSIDAKGMLIIKLTK